MKAQNSSEPNHEMALGDGLITGQESQEEDEWLSSQFRRTPILLYQYWLILNFPISLILEAYLIYFWFTHSFVEGYVSPNTAPGVGLMFSLYGCGQMLYAIAKKKSRITQEGFVKFQIALFSSVTVIYIMVEGSEFDNYPELFNWTFWFQTLYSPIIHFMGGFAILKIFKKNNPLTRLNALKFSEEEVNLDFLEQNEAIASELSKYDERLSKWPYLIYKSVLKFSVAFELIILFQFVLPFLSGLWQGETIFHDIEFLIYPFLIVWGISSLLNAYSCLQMEIAMRTRNLAKAKKAIVLLKICTVLSIIKCPFAVKCRDLAWHFNLEGLFWFIAFGYSVLVPMFGLVGALKVSRIVGERENLVKASSYSQDTYL